MRRLILALIITGGFMFVEAGVGWWSKSLALVADAGHMLTDAVALALAIVAQRIAAQQRTRARTYGHRRAEVLAAFANGIALGLTAIWIFIEAAERWRDPPQILAPAMTVTAIIGLLLNLLCAWMLGAGEKAGTTSTPARALAPRHHRRARPRSAPRRRRPRLGVRLGACRPRRSARCHRRPRPLGRLAPRPLTTSRVLMEGKPDRGRHRSHPGDAPRRPWRASSIFTTSTSGRSATASTS